MLKPLLKAQPYSSSFRSFSIYHCTLQDVPKMNPRVLHASAFQGSFRYLMMWMSFIVNELKNRLLFIVMSTLIVTKHFQAEGLNKEAMLNTHSVRHI